MGTLTGILFVIHSLYTFDLKTILKIFSKVYYTDNICNQLGPSCLKLGCAIHQPNQYPVVKFLRKPISSSTGGIDIYPVHSARHCLKNWGQKFWLYLIFLSLNVPCQFILRFLAPRSHLFAFSLSGAGVRDFLFEERGWYVTSLSDFLLHNFIRKRK